MKIKNVKQKDPKQKPKAKTQSKKINKKSTKHASLSLQTLHDILHTARTESSRSSPCTWYGHTASKGRWERLHLPSRECRLDKNACAQSPWELWSCPVDAKFRHALQSPAPSPAPSLVPSPAPSPAPTPTTLCQKFF